ncbi:MAG: hypothetical protein GKR89_00240 [Candidatus Latescibacteria bacterium]|nr:hypothetical protein [Candidatus Latescibacterota bacterium]
MTRCLAICMRQPDNELIAAECLSLTGGAPDANGVAYCTSLDYVGRSSYIRHGVEIIAQAETFAELTTAIRRARFDATDFRIEWMAHAKQCPIGRMEAIVGVADAIELYYPNLDRPQHRFLLLARDDGFVFGEIVADSQRAYQTHLAKPYRTSSALPPRLARAAINLLPPTIRSMADLCCGSGTVAVEAASMGLEVWAADRDPLAVQITRANLDYFGYRGTVQVADAAEWGQQAEGLVADLPYGINLRRAQVDQLQALLDNAAQRAPVAVFLAAEDLSRRLGQAGFVDIELFRHRPSASGNPVTRVVHRCRSAVFQRQDSVDIAPVGRAADIGVVEDHQQAVEELIRGYHQAHADHDAEALRACHADAYFRFLGGNSDNPLDWLPDVYCSRDYMMEWGRDTAVNEATYQFSLRFISLRCNDELAVAVTQESGRWSRPDGEVIGSWEDKCCVWFAALIEGNWKIVGQYWRDAG